MIDSPVRAINDVVAGFLSCRPSDDKILEYFIPPDLQLRADFLAELHGEVEITARDEKKSLNLYAPIASCLCLKPRLSGGSGSANCRYTSERINNSEGVLLIERSAG